MSTVQTVSTVETMSTVSAVSTDYSRLYWAVLDSIGLYSVVGCTGLYWDLLGCTGLYWAALGCIGLYWTVLDVSGIGRPNLKTISHTHMTLLYGFKGS